MERENFEHFSSEYAQALEAFAAIEKQASTILVLGGSDDLRAFIDRFLEMANRVKAEAEDKNEPNFAEWFRELIVKAEQLRTALPVSQ